MKKFVLLAAITLTCFGCGKGGSVIPNVQVSFQDALTDPRLSALNVPGGVVLLGGYGVAGLVIYREADGTYACYDRCSTYMPQNHCAVVIDNSFTVKDPCSTSVFSLIDGSPVKGPATQSLKPYNIEVSDDEVYISN